MLTTTNNGIKLEINSTIEDAYKTLVVTNNSFPGASADRSCRPRGG